MLFKANDDALALHFHVPILLRILGSVLGNVVENRATGLFGAPRGEVELVGGNELQLPALERTGNGEAADLLPVGPRLLIAHDEVLVVDAGQVKRQPHPIDFSRPHQTGVTERSISGDDGGFTHDVVDDVVVRHAADRVRARFVINHHGDDFLVPIELRFRGGGK